MQKQKLTMPVESFNFLVFSWLRAKNQYGAGGNFLLNNSLQNCQTLDNGEIGRAHV